MQNLEQALTRWTAAGLLDATQAERIRVFETGAQRSAGLRWPVLVAIGLGALLLAAGICSLVAAHWDALAPAARFTLLLVTVAALHGGAIVFTDRFAHLASALHAVGTVALGAAIFRSLIRRTCISYLRTRRWTGP